MKESLHNIIYITKKMIVENKFLCVKILSLLFLIMIYIITNQLIFFFMANLVLVVFMLLKTKISFFSLKTILVIYILIPFFMSFQFDYSYGIFEFVSGSYYLEANSIIFIYNFIWFLIYEKSSILDSEAKKINIDIKISNTSCIIFSALAILFTIIRLPSLPFAGIYEDRFTSLLPGNGWNHLAILSLVFVISKIKENKFVLFSYIFVIVWFLGHGERVDVAGLLVLIALYYLKRIFKSIKIRTILIFAASILFFFTTFVYIENVRLGQNFTVTNLITKTLVPSTASDVAYVYAVSIDHQRVKGNLNGLTYLSYIVEAIPMLEYKNNIDNVINRNYYTVGGNFILDEPYMNFGYFGVLLFAILEFFLLKFILNNVSEYTFYIFAILMFSVFRIVWYGISYIEVTILFCLPVLYLLKLFVDKHFDKNIGGDLNEG